MASVVVSVKATWRLNRLEFQTGYNVTNTVIGYGEVLLEEPATASPEAAAFFSKPYVMPHSIDTATKTYGTMPGAPVTRTVDAVLEESVEVEGQTLTFATVVDALKAFMEKWRIEDENKPVPEPLVPGIKVEGAPLTPMPEVPQAGPPPIPT